MVKFHTRQLRPYGQRATGVMAQYKPKRTAYHKYPIYSKPISLKKSKSKTKLSFKTKTKTHTKNKVINSPAGTVSHSYTMLTPHKAILTKGEDQLLGVNSFAYNNAFRSTSAVGFQGVQQGHNLLDSVPMTDIFTKTRGFMNMGLTPTFINSSTRLLVESVTEEQLYTNQTNVMTKLEIFDCVARKDINDGFILHPGQAIGLGLSIQPVTSSSLGTTVDANKYGTNPFQSETFTKNWKIVKVNTVYIPPGGNHTHKIHFHCNWVAKYEDFYEYFGGINFLGKKGKTVGTFIIQTGFPDNDSTTKNQVSLGTTSIDCVYKQEYKVRAIQNNGNAYNWTNNLPSSYGVGEEILNEYTQAANAFTQA